MKRKKKYSYDCMQQHELKKYDRKQKINKKLLHTILKLEFFMFSAIEGTHKRTAATRLKTISATTLTSS